MKYKKSSILLAKPRILGMVMFKIFDYSSRSIKNVKNLDYVLSIFQEENPETLLENIQKQFNSFITNFSNADLKDYLKNI